jgi:DUF2075 family protein
MSKPFVDFTSIRELAIHYSESIYNENLSKENVCIRIDKRIGSEVKSFYLHDSYNFEIKKLNAKKQDFIEYVPQCSNFEEISSGFKLIINLELYEMLYIYKY